MNLLKRLKNLWAISSWEIPKSDINFDTDKRFSFIPKKPEKVKILKKELNLQDLIKTKDE